MLTGAGFAIDELTDVNGTLQIRATRARTLPDFVGPDMRVLVCGLNPSLRSADLGFGYAGASNRFWPAATDAGLVTHARDPWRMLADDRVGMTDLVKRATVGAKELKAAEYRTGAVRVRRIAEWLRAAPSSASSDWPATAPGSTATRSRASSPSPSAAPPPTSSRAPAASTPGPRRPS